MGSTVDPILERATCDVLMFKDCTHQKYRRILVPYAGGPNSAFALETASTMVEQEGGKVVVFNVAQPGEPTQDVELFLAETVPRIKAPVTLFEIKYAVSREILGTLLEEAQDYDLVVIGATDDPLFRQRFRGSLPEEFASQCQKPLVMAKAKHPLKSFIKRWI
jgi:APA family basic amino acid/polyamine antiporter